MRGVISWKKLFFHRFFIVQIAKSVVFELFRDNWNCCSCGIGCVYCFEGLLLLPVWYCLKKRKMTLSPKGSSCREISSCASLILPAILEWQKENRMKCGLLLSCGEISGFASSILPAILQWHKQSSMMCGLLLLCMEKARAKAIPWSSSSLIN